MTSDKGSGCTVAARHEPNEGARVMLGDLTCNDNSDLFRIVGAAPRTAATIILAPPLVALDRPLIGTPALDYRPAAPGRTGFGSTKGQHA